jgi:IS4 transposase
VLAEWLLLTNVTAVNAATITLWYYWRWQIECFFKLLKQAGHHLESWQQESAAAIAKRLLVVSMACAKVWAIAADKSK